MAPCRQSMFSSWLMAGAKGRPVALISWASDQLLSFVLAPYTDIQVIHDNACHSTC